MQCHKLKTYGAKQVWIYFNQCIITSSAEQQLQTYRGHYRGKWVGKKRDFVNIPKYTYESVGSVRHIMVGRPTQLSTDTTITEFTTAEQPWLELYEKRCELEVYC